MKDFLSIPQLPQLKGVEIRSLGPQALPLTDQKSSFGVRGEPVDGWFCSQPWPEIWMQMKAHNSAEECILNLHFVGLVPEQPLAFAFYIKAESCQIAKETYLPKSLHKFSKIAKTLSFQSQLEVEIDHATHVQLVPLSGDESFWGADFLAAFTITPSQSLYRFTMRKLSCSSIP